MSGGKTVYKSAPSVSPDVLVVTPADPDFDSELAGLLGDQTQVIKQLEPYVLIVTNRSKRKIVAYSPAWTKLEEISMEMETYSICL